MLSTEKKQKLLITLSSLIIVIVCIYIASKSQRYNTSRLMYEHYSNEKIEASFPLLTGDINQGKVYMSNRTIKIGMDLNRGAGIFHLSKLGNDFNYINHFDVGRMIQQSYYGYNDGSKWNNNPWVWNPVQSGSWTDKPSKTLSITLTKTAMSTKVNPRNWGGEQIMDDVLMESNIQMYDNYVHIQFKMTYTGKINHPPKHQELPAVFVDRTLPYLNWYAGDKPWTDEPLQRKKVKLLGAQNEFIPKLTEGWAAYEHPTNKDAVGVYSPQSSMLTAYLVGESDTNVQVSDCSYFAPLTTMSIKPGETFTYDVYVTIDTVKNIRALFKKIYEERHKKTPTQAPTPAKTTTPTPAKTTTQTQTKK